MSNQFSDDCSPAHDTPNSAGPSSGCDSNQCASSAPARSNASVRTRGLSRFEAATHCALMPLMNATKSLGELMGCDGGGGAIASRWSDNLRSVMSSRCATMSRTRHEPAMVGLSHAADGRPRNSVTRPLETGRNIILVSTTAGGCSAMPWTSLRDLLVDVSLLGAAKQHRRHRRQHQR